MVVHCNYAGKGIIDMDKVKSWLCIIIGFILFFCGVWVPYIMWDILCPDEMYIFSTTITGIVFLSGGIGLIIYGITGKIE